MGCYLSALEVRDGRLYDRLTGKWVDHEEVPTLPEKVVAQLLVETEKGIPKKGGENAEM